MWCELVERCCELAADELGGDESLRSAVVTSFLEDTRESMCLTFCDLERLWLSTLAGHAQRCPPAASGAAGGHTEKSTHPSMVAGLARSGQAARGYGMSDWSGGMGMAGERAQDPSIQAGPWRADIEVEFEWSSACL